MEISILRDRRILLGVTGSIAAYKAADLASRLAQAGAEVDVILSEAGQRFVSPLTFQSVTARKAYKDSDLWGSEAHILHVEIAQELDLLIIAPATANTIAKLASGHADTLLTVIALAARCPLLIAPAMDVAMFEHPANQANLETLRQRGAVILGPAEGRMASGLVGKGRLVEPAELVGHIRLALARDGQLAGTKVVISAGATQEPIDPVRVITNRSSGKQGFALAQAALDRGAEVTLIAGQTSLPTPVGAHRINVRTAAEMQAAVLDAATQADVLLMAAAVADFKPEEVAAEKIKRKKGTRTISLEPTSDILSVVSEARKEHGRPKLTVGFAAESGDLIANARTKIESKGLALIVANDITELDAGFEVDTNRVTLVDAEGGVQELPLMTKTEVSEALIERVIYLLEELGTPLAK